MTDVVTDAVTSSPSGEVEERVRRWVRPDEGKVLGHVYSDPDVFRLEIERIWKRLWLFAGHESEVPESGDYVTRTVGTVPLIISRTPDGEVAVSVNQCRHRGNLVCNHEAGNASAFKCAYHGWTYGSDGGLIAVPYQTAYDHFDKSEHGLRRPARVALYRGFVFVSHSPEGPTLDEHLGNARAVLDRYIDASPTARLRLDAGYNRIRLDCNWKMYVENGSDNYHANFTHISGILTDEQRKIAGAISGDRSRAVVRALGHGHSDLDFRDEQRAQGLVMRSGSASGVDAEIERQYMVDLSDRLGKERAGTIVSDGPPTVYIFPNMFAIQQDIRRLEPVSATSSTSTSTPRCSMVHPTRSTGSASSVTRPHTDPPASSCPTTSRSSHATSARCRVWPTNGSCSPAACTVRSTPTTGPSTRT